MRMQGWKLLLLLLVIACLNEARDVLPSDLQKPLSSIFFGSCNVHDKPQPVWKTIEELDVQPDMFIWSGDIIYADEMLFPMLCISMPPDAVEKKYQAQKNQPDYKKLDEKIPIIGVWDDHDYGKDNGGKDYADKDKIQQIYLDLMGVPEDSPRRAQQGLYTSYMFGPIGKQVKIIMLDVRYFATPDIDVLGEAQWLFLERELTNSTAQLHLIISGTQIIASDKPVQEKWGTFGDSRRKLFDLIQKTGVPGVILISGDVHHAEILRSDRFGTIYPMYEVTSSGLTHTCANLLPFGLCGVVLEYFMTSRYRLNGFYEYTNFGTLEINWESSPVTVDMNIRDVDTGEVVLHHQVTLDELSPLAWKDGNNTAWTEEPFPFWSTVPGSFYRNVALFLIGIAGFVFGFFLWFRFQKAKLKRS